MIEFFRLKQKLTQKSKPKYVIPTVTRDLDTVPY